VTPDTDHLLDCSAGGDPNARRNLLDRHRDRLRRMVAVRLDRRLAPRVDPSDVVQEALAEAAERLDEYLAARPLPFFPWLRRIAGEKLIQAHRRHVGAARRSVAREESPPLPDESAAELAGRLFAREPSPSRQAADRETARRARAALEALPEGEREVLVLRHLEQLSVAETAEALGVTPGAVKMRHLRAVERLRRLLENPRRREQADG
jgi:RNA polymerase sigma-70 factor (ECF subfamily)